jgi:hypothetical protein
VINPASVSEARRPAIEAFLEAEYIDFKPYRPES